jgi:hypothetical protein
MEATSAPPPTEAMMEEPTEAMMEEEPEPTEAMMDRNLPRP